MQIIIESQFLPPIAAFAYFARASKLQIESQENYQKRSFRNRAVILGSSGPMNISIPLKKGKNNQQNIKMVEIAYDQNWTGTLLNQIKSAYGKSPYFEFYFDEIEAILDQKPALLFELNMNLMHFLFKQLHWGKSIIHTDEYLNVYDTTIIDLRNKIRPQQGAFLKYVKYRYYPQVFEHKFGFTSNLSILDLLFNLGPEASMILEETELELIINSSE